MCMCIHIHIHIFGIPKKRLVKPLFAVCAYVYTHIHIHIHIHTSESVIEYLIYHLVDG